MDIKLPELGEGVESGDVLSVLVKKGETVAKDQGLIELETDKASVEIPSTHAGKVTKVHVSAGDTLGIGGVIVSLETSDSPTQTEPETPQEEPVASEPESETEPVQQPAKSVAQERPQPAPPPAEKPTPPFPPAKQTAAVRESSPELHGLMLKAEFLEEPCAIEMIAKGGPWPACSGSF